MKYILSVILLATLIACSSYRNYSKQEYFLKNNSKQDIIMVNNQPYLKVNINGVKELFLFDTGASTSLITDSIFFNKIKTKDNLVKSKLYNAYKEKFIAYKILVDSITSDVFDSKNILLSYYQIKDKSNIDYCDSDKKNSISSGIMGLNNFMNSDKIIHLDFQDNNIRVFDDNFDLTNYREVPSKFNYLSKKIILYITLNNTETEFLFDTGNNAGFIVDSKVFKKEIPDQEYEMFMGGFNGLSIQQTKKYNNVVISNFPFQIEKQNVTSLSNATINTLGMRFISKFNWIIDFKKETIYCKVNDNNKNENLTDKTPFYQSLIIENQLIVGYKIKSQNKFKIGDKITSVNNQEVTPENICEMQNLLNNSEDWDTLNLVIIPSKE